LALNYADGRLYYKAANGTITYIQSGSGTTTQSFATVNANSSLILATSPTDTLSIVPGNNITISACTTTKTITINAQDADVDQFARITANNASSNTIIIQGVDATQNTRLNSLETINTNQNTTISIIQGVDNTQNTNITTANNAAWAAFAKANSALANTSGAIFGGDLNVSGNLTASNIFGTLANTIIVAGAFTTTFDTAGVITHTGNTSAISNSTGALVVTGGIATKGNVYTGNIVITGTTSNGITFADGTRQTTAASGGSGIDQYARDTANAALPQIGGTITGSLNVNGTLTVSQVYSLPTYDGINGQALVTNGAGTVSWESISAGGGGGFPFVDLGLIADATTTMVDMGTLA
jgi:hypothetical protein